MFVNLPAFVYQAAELLPLHVILVLLSLEPNQQGQWHLDLMLELSSFHLRMSFFPYRSAKPWAAVDGQ